MAVSPVTPTPVRIVPGTPAEGSSRARGCHEPPRARVGASRHAASLLVLSVSLLIAACSRPLVETSSAASRIAATGTPIDFNHDIRPILNQNCVACHGGVKMAGNISFVFREEATRAGESGRVTIKPGDPGGSELMARLTTRDPEKRMPPIDHGPPLPPGQIELFRRWIQEGARWAEHWAFVPPQPGSPPRMAAPHEDALRSPIDRFIVARLEQEGLTPAPEEDRATLLRRVALDLTGLPPTWQEVAAFLGDSAPGAYERQVDRLLASPHFGERWASLWLDLARYADTKGYEADRERTIWKYRDWLIDAFNRNLPYDRFVVEQLAGDLLPEAMLEQRIATAFHRNTQTNDEGGTSDEEFRIAAILDRTSTTWLALNGVTFNCVQCHAHPYDPIRHEEFYRFFAFFNNTVDSDYNNEHPTLKVPDDPARHDEADALQRELRRLWRQASDPGRQLAGDSGVWQPLPIRTATAEPAVEFRIEEGELFAEGTIARTAYYDVRVEPPPARLTAVRLEVPPLDPEMARHTPEHGFIVTRVEAWAVGPDGAERRIGIRRFFSDTENQFTRADPPADPAAAAKKEERPIEPGFYFAASPVQHHARWLGVVFDEPPAIPAGGVLKLRLRHGTVISSKPAPVRRLRVSVSTDARWTALAADAAMAGADQRARELAKRLDAIPGGRMPVMEELPPPERRETRTFARGNFLEKEGPPLEPDVPGLFPPLPAGAPRNRLTLAEWFVSPGQPLTARVAINRFWEQLFGTGLVETLEDFGSVGEPPSHPELLDWLALRFERDLRWDIKALLRELVLSATYRQSARVTPALLEKDPRNRLLARGPRTRLTAEMLRDQALVASGLLERRLHGPPVMPPQPEGVWASVYNARTWVDATGPDRYRRAVYTFWKRTSPYPSFLTFDAPSREVCTLRRIPTNTPLQALVSLNDPVYVEAAAALARRMQAEGGATLRERIAHGFRLVAARAPAEGELAPLVALHADSLSLYEADADFLDAIGAPDTAQLALTAVASALLNLDAVLTK
jgi:hypothetical protein